MKKCVLILTIFATVVLAGESFRLESPVYCGGTDDVLSYDDGTSYWLTWGGLYRGVWFDVTDWVPSEGFMAEYTEYWFYHHPSYPWDISSFYSELWNGEFTGPINRMNQTSMMALHNSAIVVDYGGYTGTESNILCLENTMLSSGGWPSLLGDNTPHDPSHSFYSDDFISWEPWIVQGPTANDYLIRVSGIVSAIESRSWGSIKGLFR